MPLPAEARTLIAQAISGSAVAYSLSRNPENLRILIDGIERKLDAGGYVVLARENLDDEIEEGPYMRTYEDGQ